MNESKYETCFYIEKGIKRHLLINSTSKISMLILQIADLQSEITISDCDSLIKGWPKKCVKNGNRSRFKISNVLNKSFTCVYPISIRKLYTKNFPDNV